MRLLHVREGPCAPRGPVPHDRRGAGDRRGGRAPRAAPRRSSPSASAPSCATTTPRPGSAPTATTRRSRTSSRRCRAVLTETSLLPHANAGALYRDELAALRGGGREPGDDARDAARRPRCAPPRPRQDPRATPRDARGSRGARDPVHDRDPRSASARTASTGSWRSRPSRAPHARPRPRPGGHRPELPPEAAHRDGDLACGAPSRSCAGRSRPPASMLPDDVHVQAPPNLVEDPVCIVEAGADDLGGISPVTLDHVNPERSLAAALVARRAARAPRLRAHPAAHRLSARGHDAGALARPGAAHARAPARRRRGLRAIATRGSRAAPRRPPPPPSADSPRPARCRRRGPRGVGARPRARRGRARHALLGARSARSPRSATSRTLRDATSWATT